MRTLSLLLQAAILFSIFLHPGKTLAQEEFLVESTPLPIGRAFHGSAVLYDYVFVIGGSVAGQGEMQTPTTSSQVSRISPDGQLSRWINTYPILLPRHYIGNSTIVLNDTVYILGGSEASLDAPTVSTVAFTKALPNGMLEPWRISKAFPGSGFDCTASFTTPGFLHMTGGSTGDRRVSNLTWSVPIQPDGSLGEWEQGPKLPAPLWYHCAAVVGGRAFVWGGLHINDGKAPKAPSKKIFSAQILASGRLGPWSEMPIQLPVGFYSAQAAVAGPYLFSICPRYEGAKTSNDIWWTYVTPDGMRPWRPQQTDLPNKVYIATAEDYRRGLVYITGGKKASGAVPAPETHMIRLSPEARRLAESEWQSSGGAGSISSTEFTARGGAPAGPSTATIPGFYSLDQGRVLSARHELPLVVYFHIDTANPCREQVEKLQDEEFAKLAKTAPFASVDANRFPQLAQQYGVYRVPTWVYFGSDGKEQSRAVGLQSIEQISSQLDVTK